MIDLVNIPCPDLGSEYMVYCSNENCYAVNEGKISVVKISWVVRCLCCGKQHDTDYFENELKKVGLELDK